MSNRQVGVQGKVWLFRDVLSFIHTYLLHRLAWDQEFQTDFTEDKAESDQVSLLPHQHKQQSLILTTRQHVYTESGIICA